MKHKPQALCGMAWLLMQVRPSRIAACIAAGLAAVLACSRARRSPCGTRWLQPWMILSPPHLCMLLAAACDERGIVCGAGGLSFHQGIHHIQLRLWHVAGMGTIGRLR